MDNTTITLQKIKGIYDITPVIKPPLSLLETTLLTLFFIFVITLILYIIWRLIFSIKAKSKREIEKLEKLYLNNEINSHDAAYEICNVLRVGLNIKNISEETVIPEKLIKNKKRWMIFSTKIAVLRYKNNKTTDDMTALFHESLFWLKNWP